MDISAYIEYWKFCDEAFKAEGGFLDGSYLQAYPRESEEKYRARQETASYVNIFASKINRYIGYIFKNTPTRSSQSSLIKAVFDDCDNKGNNIDVFISNFAKNAKVRGCNLLLIDMPKEKPKTYEEQLQKRGLPYFVEILPERIVEFKLDKFGRFEYVLFEDYIDNSTLFKEEIVPIYRYYDKEGWAIYDQNKNLLEQNSHSFGECPVLIFSENGDFPTFGEFSQIAKLNLRHYNLLSELDEILRSQTFPVLTINASTPKDVELKISTDNALVYQQGYDRPDFIAPPPAPAEIYIKRIKELENQIDKIAYDITTNESNESGIALDLKFQGLNASLSNFAIRLNDLENRAFALVCKILGIANDVTIAYPKSFSIIDTQKEISVLEEMKALVDSPTYNKLKALQIISADLNTIEPDDFAKIASEIEDEQKG